MLEILYILLILAYLFFKYLQSYINDYSLILKVLKNVEGNDENFLNVGYWDKCNTLTEANYKLCDFVLEKGKFYKDQNILDIGVGYGIQDFHWIKSIEGNITGIDIFREHIKEANKRCLDLNLQDRIKFMEGNAINLEFKDNTFDLVIANECAFHFNTREKYLKEAYRVLKKGGSLILVYKLQDIPPKLGDKLSLTFYNSLLKINYNNRISINQLNKQLDNIGFTYKYDDITENTIKPYFKYFNKNFKRNINFIITYMSNMYLKILEDNNYLKYVIYVCVK